MTGPTDDSHQRHHERLLRIFSRAVELDGVDRERFLDEECGRSPALRRDIEGLIAADEKLHGAWADRSKDHEGSSGSKSQLLRRISELRKADSRYEVLGEVARGGMGAIMRIWDDVLQRTLAMKVSLASSSASGGEPVRDSDSRQLDRFLEEAQVTAQLDHPGIVPVHELSVDDDGRVFFTMKLVKGRSLKEVLDEVASGSGEWDQVKVLGALLRVCEAMRFAHSKGVIHRDLKPSNIMVGRFGEVYVMDWGLARVLQDRVPKTESSEVTRSESLSGILSERSQRAADSPGSSLATMEGDVLGTPAYMPPEQAEGRASEVGPLADVYAIGAILYHLLVGHVPFVGRDERPSNLEILSRVRSGPPPALGEVVPSAPSELVAICEKAMARDPRARYADMSALAADLAAFLEGRVVRAYETGAWAEARKWVRRNRALAASLALAGSFALLGSTGIAVVQARGRAAAEAEEIRADAKAKEALENLTLAREERARAEASEDRALEEMAKVLRLSDRRRLDQLIDEADELWPPHPDNIARYEGWLGSAHALCDRLPGHLAVLQALEERASPRRGEQDAEGLAFESEEDAWQYELLLSLTQALTAFADERTGLISEGMTETGGWGVARRLELAVDLRDGFQQGGRYAEAWSAATGELAEAYPGLDLQPQVGLVPIGPDPDSGLWEFAHLLSGEPAERGPDGRLEVRPETGIVLVLVPGEVFWMGAQSEDPSGPNYDPRAMPDEGPVREVEVPPYFISKYEATADQWRRVTGREPNHFKSSHYPGRPRPVERVSWKDCDTWLRRIGLVLPTEAQWERATRAGTTTPWWTGAERDSLVEHHAANLADQAAARASSPWQQSIDDWPELDDGHATHAPVGTYSANPFGLHEVHGNVMEWCRDAYVSDPSKHTSRLAPFHAGEPDSLRVNRGGAFALPVLAARSAFRNASSPSSFDPMLGVRPARELQR